MNIHIYKLSMHVIIHLLTEGYDCTMLHMFNFEQGS